MKTQNYFLRSIVRKIMVLILVFAASFTGLISFAHCDSYDGPVIKDAMKALETNNVKLVLKWIDKKQEPEIVTLFNKTYSLRKGDKEIYSIVEKHFFETLVRLHRETEGAPYTCLKPAGETKEIIKMSDKALQDKNIDGVLSMLNSHLNQAISEKYNKVAELDKLKDTSPEKGREYVKAYIDYTHSLEALYDIGHSEKSSDAGGNRHEH